MKNLNNKRLITLETNTVSKTEQLCQKTKPSVCPNATLMSTFDVGLINGRISSLYVSHQSDSHNHSNPTLFVPNIHLAWESNHRPQGYEPTTQTITLLGGVTIKKYRYCILIVSTDIGSL